MVTREKLISTFGENGVISLDEKASRVRGLQLRDAEILERVGLPVFVDILFTLKVEGEPGVFTVLPVETGQEVVNIFILGGPTDSPSLRYFLDLRRGYVVLLSSDPGGVQAEIVNSSLENFIDFLCRVALHNQEVADLPGNEKRDRVPELRADLEAGDPLAFSDPDSWWSVVLDALSNQK